MEFLLVDDNDISLEIQKLMLESCGLTVETAMSGSEAVMMAEKKEYFMIFMDIHMPDMTGFQAAKLIREKNTNTPIIALSADAIADDDPQFIDCAMNASLLKPLQMTDLKELLGRFLVVDFVGEKPESAADTVFSYDSLFAVMHTENAVLRLLDQFLGVHADDCTDLEKFAKNGDFLSAREILHNIIGISGNMFCKKLYRASCELSDQLKEERYDSLGDFRECWDETIEQLSERRKSLAESVSVSSGIADWDTLRHEFMALCGEFDVAAADLFTENIGTFTENLSPADLEQLKNAVFNYDFLWITENMEVLNV